MPPAFILSQDQTLQKFMFLFFIVCLSQFRFVRFLSLRNCVLLFAYSFMFSFQRPTDSLEPLCIISFQNCCVNIFIQNILRFFNDIKWWMGTVSNRRTLREQIYSLPRLASSLPIHLLRLFHSAYLFYYN